LSSGCWQDLAGVFFLLATLSILFNDRTASCSALHWVLRHITHTGSAQDALPPPFEGTKPLFLPTNSAEEAKLQQRVLDQPLAEPLCEREILAEEEGPTVHSSRPG
jgi:hypothetical protein